jgi:DNA helicase-2/ATP-dependent DNA helicase PcrA
LIDEYQDTNQLQASILMALKPNGAAVSPSSVTTPNPSMPSGQRPCATSWTFPSAFSPPADDHVTLDRNYRSTQPILAAANAVIGLAARSVSRRISGRNVECAQLEPAQLVTVSGTRLTKPASLPSGSWKTAKAGTDAQAAGGTFQDVAVTAVHLEVELTRRNIPFVKFGGLKFLDSAHVKDHTGDSCASRRTRGTGWQAFGFCSCCRTSGQARRNGFSTR